MLLVVIVLWSIKERRLRLSPLVVVGSLLLVAMTYLTINAAFQSDSQDSRFNSLNSRISTYDASVTLWGRDPLIGVGLKYWRDPAFGGELAFGEPHDLVVSALGESGVVGLLALVVLVGSTILVITSGRSPVATFAVLIVIAKVIDSVTGIFWVAGTLTFMWIAVGLGLRD